MSAVCSLLMFFCPSASCPCLVDCCMCAGLHPSHSHGPMAALNKQRPHSKPRRAHIQRKGSSA
jgi:hypothetical protein